MFRKEATLLTACLCSAMAMAQDATPPSHLVDGRMTSPPEKSRLLLTDAIGALSYEKKKRNGLLSVARHAGHILTEIKSIRSSKSEKASKSKTCRPIKAIAAPMQSHEAGLGELARTASCFRCNEACAASLGGVINRAQIANLILAY